MGPNTLEVACAVPNDTWYFEIRPATGWITPTQEALNVLLLLVLLSVMLRSMLSEAAVMRIIHVDLRREFVIEFALTAVFLISTCLLPYWWGLGVYGAALGGYLLGKRRDLRQLAHTLRRT